MQAGEADEVLVVDAAVEVALGFFEQHVDLLQSLQVPHGGGVKQAEHEVYGVGEAAVALLLVRHEVDHHVRFVVAHRDADALVEDNAEGNGSVGRAAGHFLYVGNA